MVVVILVVGAVVVASVLPLALTRRGAWYVRQWVTEHGYRLVSIKPLSWSRGAWGLTFTTIAEGRTCRFYDITTIDDRSIERVGTAKYRRRPSGLIEVRWSSETQPAPGRPDERVPSEEEVVTEGWGADPTRRHEQRWISAGTPTALVRDGLVEGHDPMDDRRESEGRAGS
jgi:hypothetical protein